MISTDRFIGSVSMRYGDLFENLKSEYLIERKIVGNKQRGYLRIVKQE